VVFPAEEIVHQPIGVDFDPANLGDEFFGEHTLRSGSLAAC
jgi:hypothetical protein